MHHSMCHFSVQPRSTRSLNRLLAVFLLIMAWTLAASAQAGLLSPESRHDVELRPGVVYIKVQATGTLHGLPLPGGPVSGRCAHPAGASGSGFLYRPDGYLITNGHVAQLAYSKDEAAVEAQKMFIFASCFQEAVEERLRRRLTDAEAKYASRYVSVDGTALEVYLDNGKHFEGEVKQYSPPFDEGGKDVAVVKIDGNNLPTVPLGDSDAINVNDKVYTIGYPGAAKISDNSLLVATSSDGIISAVKSVDYSKTPLLQTNANINHGNSGGPAFNAAGDVIGITTMGSPAPGYNFLVPINTAKEFVRAAGAEPQRGTLDKVWHDALDAYVDQDWVRAHDLTTEALEMFPDQPDARRLQAQAAANIPFESPVTRAKDTLGTGGIIAICVVALAIAGVIVWLLVRKPARRAGMPPGNRSAAASAGAAAASKAISPPISSSSSVSLSGAGPSSGSAAALGVGKASEVSARTALPGEPSYGSLIISGGPLTGNRFQVTKAGLMIGRDPSKCTVILPDDSVSKEHAWVVPTKEGVTVIDRNSANGTYVNSVDSPRINKVVLRHGDRVYLGKKNQTVFTYYSS
jgi:S1-C subfamily serine protease